MIYFLILKYYQNILFISFITDKENYIIICQRLIAHQRPRVQKPLRIVPGFSIQSYQKNVITDSPPKAMVKKTTTGKTLFRMYYNRGDIPVCLEFRNRNKITWKVSFQIM